MLAEVAPEQDLGAKLVVVTPSRSMEDEQLARQLTPPGAHLHMGSETWFAYGVGLAGTFVLVRSDPEDAPPWAQAGRVLGSAHLAGEPASGQLTGPARTPRLASVATLATLVKDWRDRTSTRADARPSGSGKQAGCD